MHARLPDLKTTVREMLKRGMSEQEIRENLRDLGVDDPDSVYASAVAEEPAGEAGDATPSVSKLAAAAYADTEKLEKKIGELAAKVDALLEVNQQILDTNRQILLRIKE